MKKSNKKKIYCCNCKRYEFDEDDEGDKAEYCFSHIE